MIVPRLFDAAVMNETEQGVIRIVRTEDEFLPRFQGVDGKRCFNGQLAPPEVISYAAGITHLVGGTRLSLETGKVTRTFIEQRRAVRIRVRAKFECNS